MQLAHGLHQWRHRVLEHHGIPLQPIHPFDVGTRRALDENLRLYGLESRLQGVGEREVTVDDGVRQRVEDKTRAQAQEIRLALAAAAHAQKILPAVVAH